MNDYLSSISLDFSSLVFNYISKFAKLNLDTNQSENDFDTNGIAEYYFSNMPIPIATIDMSLKFVKVNQAFCKLLQYSEREVLKMTMPELSSSEDASKSLERIHQLENKSIESFIVFKNYIKKNGDVISAITVVTGHYNKQAKLVGTTASIFDLSLSFIPENSLKEKSLFNQFIKKDSKPNTAILFNLVFQSYNKELYEKLKNINPKLNQNELEHCAYIKINLTPKDVAKLYGVEPKSVEMARYRIKKKLNLKSTERLKQFILKL